jgi:hypothetical protein
MLLIFRLETMFRGMNRHVNWAKLAGSKRLSQDFRSAIGNLAQEIFVTGAHAGQRPWTVHEPNQTADLCDPHHNRP